MPVEPTLLLRLLHLCLLQLVNDPSEGDRTLILVPIDDGAQTNLPLLLIPAACLLRNPHARRWQLGCMAGLEGRDGIFQACVRVEDGPTDNCLWGCLNFVLIA